MGSLDFEVNQLLNKELSMIRSVQSVTQDDIKKWSSDEWRDTLNLFHRLSDTVKIKNRVNKYKHVK